MSITVYTAIGGGKDKPLPVQPKFSTAKYVIFTDKPTTAHGWDEVRPLPVFSSLTRPSRRNAKAPKILPWMFFDTEFAIWMDGTHMCVKNPEEIVTRYLIDPQYEMATFDHGRKLAGQDHNCIYKEAQNIKNVGFLEDAKILDEQCNWYRHMGFPENYGLTCNTVIVWRNSPEIRELQLAWWEQICRFSSRDQMSLFYSHWSCGTRDLHGLLPGHWERNDLIKRMRPHAHLRK